MKLVALSLVFCAMAVCQDAVQSSILDGLNPKMPDLAQRFKSMKLLIPGRPVIVVTGEPKICAIPLLNALPARSSVDYKIRVVKPAWTDAQLAATAPAQLGMPACKSAR